MDIPKFHQYHALCFSGCSQKFSKFYGQNRLYTIGHKYELELLPIVAVFDFVWYCKLAETDKTAIIRNMPFDCPLQLLVIDEQIDYESFTSLN